MNADSPLATHALFYLGPAPISSAVVTTWGIMAFLTLVCAYGMRRMSIDAGPLQTVLEIVVETIEGQIRGVVNRDPWPYLPLLGTLFLYLVAANLLNIIPGLSPPTAHIETPAALAAIVFVSVHFFGIKAHGLGTYLKRYIRPSAFMLPLNVLSEITRTFSLMVRLFGNIMSHELVIGVVVLLAGLLVPVPFMLLGLLIGLIQAFIFTILATVFIGAAIGAVEAG